VPPRSSGLTIKARFFASPGEKVWHPSSFKNHRVYPTKSQTVIMYACAYISTALNPSEIISKFHGVDMFAISSCFM